jgi:peroxiredoxin
VKELGGNIVALTPQKVERTVEQLKKNPIEYGVLSDFENAYANELGIRFEMPDNLIELYQKFGLDFPNFHGESTWTLPMPSRMVIAASVLVLDVEVNADYTRRPEPSETLQALIDA